MISAAIPVYDTSPAELRESLDSLRRTRVVSEIVLVDDRSTNSGTCTELQRQSELGARVLVNQGKKGTQPSRSLAAHAARGCYILQMDSDDLIYRTGKWSKDCLAPVNFTVSTARGRQAATLWEYLESPQGQMWGAVLEAGLYRSLLLESANREEDIGMAYRLWITIWRDRLLIRQDSGLRYTWRQESPNRNSMTGRYGRDREKLNNGRVKYLKEAVASSGLTGNEATAVLTWGLRGMVPDPVVEKRDKGARVDVHVLSYSRPSSWLRQTLDSLEGEPCNTHIVVGGFHGSIGKARAYAFQLGQAEYVSFVDDDDVVLPGVMQSLVDYLDEHPDCVGVYTDLYHVHENSPGRRDLERKGPWRPMRQLLYCPEITHLKVMRREVVEEYLDEVAKWPTYEEYVLVGMMCERGRWQHIPVPGILKRYTAFSSSSMRLTNVPLWKRAVARVTPAIMQAHRRQGCGR